ncbi:sushi, von Willebrand factor type A, EGF and pentraxin domain-containing protein 1-like isoform X1 [Styela clava]
MGSWTFYLVFFASSIWKLCNGDHGCGGACLDYRFTVCPAGYQTGKCSGGSFRRCCLPCDVTCQSNEDSYNDDACEIALGGNCQDNTNYCPQGYIAGRCGGPAGRQCCPGGDYRCLQQGGTCQDVVSNRCTRLYEPGFCSGNQFRQCCLPCDGACQNEINSYDNTACENLGGVCMHNSNYCPRDYITGKCDGQGRDCCPGPDWQCLDIGGTCQNWIINVCIAGYEEGLCTEANSKCCRACDSTCQTTEQSYTDPACQNVPGTCRHSSNFCPLAYDSATCEGSGERSCCPLVSCGTTGFDNTNGQENCDNSFFAGSTCSFTCNIGFRLVGPDSMTCSMYDSGSWTPVNAPMCSQISCPDLSFTGDGTTFDCTNGNLWGSVCTYGCMDGYDLNPTPTLGSTIDVTCTDDTSWQPSPPSNPVCIIRTCPELQFEGFITCVPPNSRDYGTICSYTCPIGKEPAGGDEITLCGADSQWSGDQLQCDDVNCGETGFDKTNGQENCDKNYFAGSKCDFTCNDGFRLVGTDSMTCLNSQSWEPGDAPTCSQITCMTLSFVGQGTTFVCTTGNLWGGVCTYGCMDGYDLSPTPTLGSTIDVTCTDTSLWQPSPPSNPSCIIRTCTELQFEGTIDCTPPDGRNFGTICSYTCPDGKEPIGGSDKTLCESDGQWSGDQLQCGVVMCQQLVFPPGIFVCTNGFDYHSECSFKCPIGTEPDVTGKVMKCEIDKQWSGSMPSSCDPISCGDYGEVENGQANCDSINFGGRCTVSCNFAYKAAGPEYVECEASKQWSGPPLRCERIYCPALDFSDQPGTMTCDDNLPRFSYPSTCSFECVPGHDLTGTSSLTCQGSGDWNGNVPTCKDVFCPDLTIEDGVIECTDGQNYASLCTFSCASGITLFGERILFCQSNSKWSHDIPQCKLFDPDCPTSSATEPCIDECNNNGDCNEGKICCPNACASVCMAVPTPEPPNRNRNLLRTLTVFQLLQRRQRPVSSAPVCPPGRPPSPGCGSYLCNGIRCATNSQARCRVYSCGGCWLQFFDSFGRRVSCSRTASCQPGLNQFSLCPTQCTRASCPRYPRAHCRVTCPWCPPQFYDQRTKRPITNCYNLIRLQ